MLVKNWMHKKVITVDVDDSMQEATIKGSSLRLTVIQLQQGSNVD